MIRQKQMIETLKENKLAIALVGLVSLATFIALAFAVRADTNVTVDVWSDGDVNVFGNIFANGSVNVNIDGTDVNQRFTDFSNSFNSYVDWEGLVKTFKGVSDYFWNREQTTWMSQNIFYYLNQVFVNRYDEQVINNKLNNLNVRVTALEKAVEKIDAASYCAGRLDTMREFNLTSVDCGETRWYNQREILIGITPA